MCGRYSLLEESDDPVIRQIIRQVGRSVKYGEICPTNQAPILAGESLQAQAACWGFARPGGSGVVINARAETAAEKRMFKNSLLARRCIIPSTGFFEWDATKRKHWFGVEQGPLYMAGLYQEAAGQRQFVILTTAANASMAPIHDRMPVVLRQEQLVPWIRSVSQALSILRQEPPPIAAASAIAAF